MGNFVVCVPEHWWHTDNSTQERCVECDSIVWVSISGMNTAKEFGCEFICVFCAELQEDTVTMPPTPEQIEAVERNARKQAERN